MEIILMCPGAESGQSAFRAEMIEGIQAPERRYNIVNGRVVLSGYEDSVLHHDADELLKNPLYRMPTPAEQNEMAGQPFKVGELQESADNPAPTDPDPEDEPPAVENGKKKASGG